MLEDVRAVFLKVSNQQDGQSPSSLAPERYRFRISGNLYAMHLNLHRETRALIDQLERVLDDGEHRTLIEEGRVLKMRMPDTDSFRLRIEAMRAHLDSYDLRDIKRLPNDRVEVPMTTARNMHTTTLLTTSFVYDFFYAILATDYMKNIRRLKSEGVTYAGPICVQEAFNPYLTLHYLASFLRREAAPGHLPANWMRRPPAAKCDAPSAP